MHPLRRKTDFLASDKRGGRLPRTTSVPVNGGRISPTLGTPEVTDRLHTALILDFEGPHATKRLAQAANTNVRTAKDLLARKNGMSLSTLLNVATSGQAPAVRKEAARLLAMDSELDPEAERGLHELLRLAGHLVSR